MGERKLATRLMKSTWHSRPHNMVHSWCHGLETASTIQTTIYPLIIQDEGLGDPSAYNSHPEHASFVEANEPNVYPESRVDTIFGMTELEMTKGALETDKIHGIKYATMDIYIAFKEDLTATADASTVEIQDILELDSESTDRQAYPLWNDVDMTVNKSSLELLPTKVPSLDTTQAIEGVTFSSELYYDTLHYSNLSGKLKSVQTGLRWGMLTRQRPYARIPMRIRSDVKKANPYTLCARMIHIPINSSAEQLGVATDTTNIPHVRVTMTTRYDEWNENFDHTRV